MAKPVKVTQKQEFKKIIKKARNEARKLNLSKELENDYVSFVVALNKLYYAGY